MPQIDSIIRKAHAHELDAIMLMISRAVANMQSHGIYQWGEEYPNATVIAQDISDSALWVYELDGAIAGIAVMNSHSEPEYDTVSWQYIVPYQVIHRVCIDPSAQRRGVATALVAHLEQTARDARYKAIRLDTFSQNPFALALYAKLGYNQVGTVYFPRGKFFCFEKLL